MKKILTIILLTFSIIFSVNAEEFEAYTAVVGMNGEFLDEEIVRVSVNVSDLINPVIGGAFHLIFEKDRLDFLKYEPGDFFEMGGDPFYLVKEAGAGEVIFGTTLKRGSDFPLGNGKIADFYFQKIKDEQEYKFDFTHGVLSTFDTVRQDLDRIDWQGFVLKKDDEKSIFTVEENQIDGDLFGKFKQSIVKDSNFWIYLSWGFIGLYFLVKYMRSRIFSSV